MKFFLMLVALCMLTFAGCTDCSDCCVDSTGCCKDVCPCKESCECEDCKCKDCDECDEKLLSLYIDWKNETPPCVDGKCAIITFEQWLELRENGITIEIN